MARGSVTCSTYSYREIIAELCGYRADRRRVCRRPASSTPTTNIMPHQSRSPPPLLLGAVPVSDLDALAELPREEAVESASAAIVLAYVPAVALLTVMVMEQLPLAGISAPAMVTVLAELVSVPDEPLHVVVGAGEVCTLRPAGTGSAETPRGKTKPLAFTTIMVS